MRIIAAFVLSCTALGSMASPQSEALKREGLQALESNRHAEAIARFRAALRADPADRDAAFFLGSTFNRIGDFSGAFLRLKALEDAGYRNRELDLELGWSLLGMGRGAACVPRLHRYETAVPGRAITPELLGRCQLLLRDLDPAEASLREALRRDPGAKHRVDLYLAQVQYARGDRSAAAAALAGLVSGDAALGRSLRQGEAALAAVAPRPGLGWRFSGSVGAGHNSNVIGLGNTIPLPADISSKSAAFARASFGVSFTAEMDAQTRGTAGYSFLTERYDAITAANLEDHYFYGDVSRRLSERLAVSLRGSLQLTRLGGGHFRTQPAVRPAVAFRFDPASTTELSYSLALPEYTRAALAANERSGEFHALAINHVIQPESSRWSGSIGASIGANRTEGAEFRSMNSALSGALRYAFTPTTHLTVGASVAREDYDNQSAFATFARKDRPQSAFVQLSGPLGESLRYHVQLQGSSSGSNITFFDFKQQVLFGGISAEF